MASGDGNLTELVETDDASLISSYKQETLSQPGRFIACSKKEYHIQNPPQNPVTILNRFPIHCNPCIDYYQCSQEKEKGSGSDSAEEEDSPFGSPEIPKYENLVPSGKFSPKNSRKQRHPNSTNALIEEPEQQFTFSAKTNIDQQQSGPYAKEEVCFLGAFQGIAVSGSRTKTVDFTQKTNIYIMPRSEVDPPLVDNNKEDELSNLAKKGNMFEDINMRLRTYYSGHVDWPHATPSAELMAAAGLIFMGVFNVRGTTVYDMVECYKCKGRLCGFTKDDDPVKEHGRLYPKCN